MPITKLVLPLFLGALAHTQAVSAQITVDARPAGPAAPRTESYAVSSNGVHYGVLAPNGNRNVLLVDGVAGPEFDVFLNRRGHPGTVANNGLVFSADGLHSAYFAAIGSQYLFVLDGKERYRAELGPSNLGYQDMQFSPGGKHAYFIDLNLAGTRARAQLVMDGQAGPPSGHQNIFPVFSPDDSHWAYNAVKFGGRPDEFISVVDGKEVPFVGFDPYFTADNKLIATLQLRAGDPAVLTIDGKPAVKGVSSGGKIGAAPVGSRWAGVVMPKKPGDPNTLYIDGKEVPAAQNVEEVVFSPDGKRYMAICSNRATRAKYVVLDGKKGPEYQTIDRALLSFSLDSYRAIYVGNDMGKSVVVVDGQPSASYAFLMGQRKKIVLSQHGGHYAYVWSDGSPLGQTLVIDGKPIPMSGKGLVLETLSLSADGSRHAFVATRSGQAQRRLMVVDGTEMPGVILDETIVDPKQQGTWWDAFGLQSRFYQFSPDGKHVFFVGMRLSDNRHGVFVDGKAVFFPPVPGLAQFVTWSPDSRHVFWAAPDVGGSQPRYRVYVDGKPSTVTYSGPQPAYIGLWQVGADGALQVLVFEGAAAKRYRITPGNDTSVDSLIAAAR